MKQRWIAAVAVMLAAAALGCGVRVAVESDPGQRHAGWKTWSWLQRPPVAHGDTDFAAIDERVRRAVEREMKTRGFRQVDRQRPDFLLTYYAAVLQPIDAKALDYAAGGPSSARSAAQGGAYAQGMLIVDVLDASSGRLAWRGAGRGVFSLDYDPQERNERIDQAAARVVSEFSAR